MLTNWLLVILGIGLLYGGGEALVRGSITLARLLGLSPLVVGLTVVSFGTSSPELASTLAAALRGSPEVALGNVVGSNIANLGLILGLTAIFWPLRTTARFLRREVPFMLAASVLMFVLVNDGVVARLEGLLLVLLLAVFLIFLLLSKPEAPQVQQEFNQALRTTKSPIGLSLLLVAVGIALLVLGARMLVTGGINIAHAMGVSERIIGLTMVALGTSLPELASSIVAALKREGDIVLGNIIGSNVFNILCILGTTVLVRPISIDAAAARIDLFVMLGLSALVWPFLMTRLRLERWEGMILLTSYIGYIWYLFA